MPRWNYTKGIFRQFITFAGVGVIGTLTHYAVLVILVQIAELTPVLASGAGFVSGALVNYCLNYRITFHSNKRHHEAIIKFFTVASIGLLLNTLVMALATEILYIHYLLSQMVATGLVLIWNFAGNRYWTFREKIYTSRL